MTKDVSRNSNDRAPEVALLGLESGDESGLGPRFQHREIGGQGVDAIEQTLRVALLEEPVVDVAAQLREGRQARADDRLGLRGPHTDDLLGHVLQARSHLAGQPLALLVVRKDAAEQEAHEEHVGGDDAREQRVDGDHFPAEVVGDQLPAHEHDCDEDHSQEQTVVAAHLHRLFRVLMSNRNMATDAELAACTAGLLEDSDGDELREIARLMDQLVLPTETGASALAGKRGLSEEASP